MGNCVSTKCAHGNDTDVKLELSDDSPITRDAVQWCLSHGLVMSTEPGVSRPVPTTTRPSPFPSDCYNRATALCAPFNKMCHVVSRDAEFIRGTLKHVVTVDKFTGRLLDIWERCTQATPQAQPLELGIFRSDYMLHHTAEDGRTVLQQVELNTIASSFGCLSDVTGDFHRYMATRYYGTDTSKFPANSVGTKLARGISTGYDLYGKKSSCVLFVVQPGETNVFDQKMLEWFLWENHGIRVLRRTLLEISREAVLDPNTMAMTIDGVEISVTYFRAGYAPTDYPSDKEWEARELIEKSLSIKCPSMAYHLAGTKKVQQVLAMEGVLEKYVTVEEAKLLRTSFADLYTLTREEGKDVDAIVKMAIENPHKYVLKPQREGGGNNLYGDEMKAALEKLTPEELSAFILMSRITPPAVENSVLRNGVRTDMNVVSELGIYGVVIGRGDMIMFNSQAGHLLRSKAADKDDGGVAAGVAVLDSPYLFT